MGKQDAIKIFEDKKVRALWNDEKELWYFSIVDVIAALTNSPNPRNRYKLQRFENDSCKWQNASDFCINDRHGSVGYLVPMKALLVW